MKDHFLEFKELALGSRLKRLSERLMKGTLAIYKELAIDFDPYHMPIFKLVSEDDGLIISEISKKLGVSQPAVTQYVNLLSKKSLLVNKTSKNDKRKKKIFLSNKGKLLLKELFPVWRVIDNELQLLSNNHENKTLLDHVLYIENEIKIKSFKDRILSKYQLINQKTDLKIVSFKEKYAIYFRDLNIEWLEKYFYVEKHDYEVLENAKTYIIDNGGYIFFAIYNNNVVGTVALMNEDEGFELSKMAVNAEFQGLKIGQQLMQHCIDFAKNKKLDKLILYSNKKLESAIYIYKKFGFQEVDIEKDSPYLRSNIKMILKF